MAELTDAAAEARREYARQWRRNHPENCRRYAKTYWEKQAAKAREAEKNTPPA